MLGMRRRGRGSGRERTAEEVAGEAALKRRLLTSTKVTVDNQRKFWANCLDGKIFTRENSGREW